MKLNTQSIPKRGVYGTATLPIWVLIEALRLGKIKIPVEQREMENKNKAYYKKAKSFIGFLMIQSFVADDDITGMTKVLQGAFGVNVTVIGGVPQLIGISIDADGNIYLSDGQHRFLNYLMDFIQGNFAIEYGFDFGNKFMNDSMRSIFDNIKLEDGDGTEDSQKKISIQIFEEADWKKLVGLNLTAATVQTDDDDERASLFVSMNTATPIRPCDIDHAIYAKYNMWIAIEEVRNTLDTITKNTEYVTFDCGKTYDNEEARILRTLFYAPMRTLVPMVTHMGLLTFLPKNITKKYQWQYTNQTQVEQVRAFFTGTHSMTLEECRAFLAKIMDEIIKIGEICYEGDFNMMDSAKGLKSLLVGQLHAQANAKKCGISKKEFKEKAAGITADIIDNAYRPIGHPEDKDPFGRNDFNNAHHNRKKNELFLNWLVAECEAGKETK